MNNKLIIFISSLILYSNSFAEIDLSRGYRNKVYNNSFIELFNKDKNYLKFNVSYTNFNINSSNDIKSSLTEYAKIKETSDNVLKLSKDLQQSMIIGSYSKFKSNNSIDNYLVGLSIKIDENSNFGFIASYEENKLENVIVNNGIIGGVFYNFESDELNSQINLLYGKNYINEKEHSDKTYYAGNIKIDLLLPIIKNDVNSLNSFAFVEAFGISKNYEKEVNVKIKKNNIIENKKEWKTFNEKTANGTIGIGIKKLINKDNFNVITTAKVGYNREFFNEDKFKSLNLIEKNKNNMVVGSEIEIETFNRFNISLEIQGKFSITEKNRNEILGKINFNVKI